MKYLKTLAIEFILFIVLTLINVILYYFNIISSNMYSIFKIITFVITFLISGIYIAKKTNKRFYLEGLKIAIINIIIFLLFSLITKYSFNLTQLLYYICIILTTMFGSILGGLKRK